MSGKRGHSPFLRSTLRAAFGGKRGMSPFSAHRLLAVLALAVFSLGGAYLAHALVGDWTRAPAAGERGPAPTGVPAEAVGAAAAPAANPQPPAVADLLLEAARMAETPSTARARIDPRLFAEHLAGGPGPSSADALPPPAGARRLLALPGGLAFYRLPAGLPAAEVDRAAAHYRRALADAHWQLIADNARTAPVADGDGPRAARLLIATRGGATLAVFVNERRGAAYALVRTMENRVE
jgi:hypothetical protein